MQNSTKTLLTKRVRPMDKLAKQLREDADQNRMCCFTMNSMTAFGRHLKASSPKRRKHRDRESKSFSFWWASSLTGVAAASPLLRSVNLQAPDPGQVADRVLIRSHSLSLRFSGNVETAVLTSPLEQEIEDLQSDLKKQRRPSSKTSTVSFSILRFIRIRRLAAASCRRRKTRVDQPKDA